MMMMMMMNPSILAIPRRVTVQCLARRGRACLLVSCGLAQCQAARQQLCKSSAV